MPCFAIRKSKKSMELPFYHSKKFSFYEDMCQCEARNFGRTTQSFLDRINPHFPSSIRKNPHGTKEQSTHMCKISQTRTKHNLAIGQNPQCTNIYTDDNFEVLGKQDNLFLQSFNIEAQNSVLRKTDSFVFYFGLYSSARSELVLTG